MNGAVWAPWPAPIPGLRGALGCMEVTCPSLEAIKHRQHAPIRSP
jgi:hypothetical protein